MTPRDAIMRLIGIASGLAAIGLSYGIAGDVAAREFAHTAQGGDQ